MALFDRKDDVAYLAQSVEHQTITDNDYNLSVSAYVEAEDTHEVIDITQLNADLKTTVSKIDKLRRDIDVIVAEIEGDAT
jgi:type I restriction enzyme M protein